MKRPLWLLLGLLSTGCGIIGAVLPLIPTTPFLLLAAFAFGRSSPRLHGWLLDHRQFGPLIINWQQHGCIDRRVKATAVVVMIAMLALTWLSGVAAWLLAVQAAVLTVVATWLLTRPGRPDADECGDPAVPRSKRIGP